MRNQGIKGIFPDKLLKYKEKLIANKTFFVKANVLADKDVKKAIADRASWRDDERRWYREGKLPKPGWWE